MKKLLSIALAAGSMAALADTTPTTIMGQSIGSTTITSSLTNTIVAVSFKELGPLDQNISVSNIVGVANLAEGDKVYVLVNGSYQGWTLTQGDNYKYWAKNDGTFSLNAGGQPEQGSGASADEIRPTVGTGVWLQRCLSLAGQEFTFYVYGAVPSSTTTTVTAGTKTLFGNPTNTAKAPTISGMVNGDRILIPTDGAPNTIKYNSKGKWVYSQGATVKEGIPDIPSGTGAWYVSTGNENVTINW